MQDRTNIAIYNGLIGSRIRRWYALSIGTKINDLGWPWTAYPGTARCFKYPHYLTNR